MPSRKNRSKGTFTATQVGALVETFRNEIRVVVEGLTDVHKELRGFRDWRLTTTRELEGFRDWRCGVTKELEGFRDWRTGVSQELSAIKTDIGSIRTDLKGFDQRLQTTEAKVGL